MATENVPEPELPDVPERLTAKREGAVILEVMKGTISVPGPCRRHGIAQGDYQDWIERFVQGGDNALNAKPKEEADFESTIYSYRTQDQV